MAITVNWEIDAGDDETLVFTFPAGVDISARTYTAEVRTTKQGTTVDAATLLETATCAIDGQDVTVELTDVQTRALADQETMFWGLRETLADGTTDVLFGGQVLLKRTAVQ